MKKLMISLVGMITLAIVGGNALADGSVWASEDAGVAMRVKNGYTVPVQIRIYTTNSAASQGQVVIGTFTNTFAGAGGAGGTNATITKVAATIAACTNAAGKALLTVDYTMSLGADVTTNTLMTGTNTIQEGQWGTALTWDTGGIPGVNSKYSAFVPKRTCGGNGDMKKITKVFGNIGGTGDITVRAYLDQALVAEKIIDSPIYVMGSLGSATNSVSDDVTAGMINIDWPIVVGPDQTFFVRGERATTGTTGGIGFSWDTIKQ